MDFNKLNLQKIHWEFYANCTAKCQYYRCKALNTSVTFQVIATYNSKRVYNIFHKPSYTTNKLNTEFERVLYWFETCSEWTKHVSKYQTGDVMSSCQWVTTAQVVRLCCVITSSMATATLRTEAIPVLDCVRCDFNNKKLPTHEDIIQCNLYRKCEIKKYWWQRPFNTWYL